MFKICWHAVVRDYASIVPPDTLPELASVLGSLPAACDLQLTQVCACIMHACMVMM